MNRFFVGIIAALVLVLLPLAGAAFAGFTKGPYLLDLNKRGVTVVWETNDASGTIYYGEVSGNLDQEVEVSGNDNNMLRGKIECLRPNTQYFYKVKSGLQTSDEHTFFTGVEPEEPFFFIAYGDTRTNIDDHQAVVDAIMAETPDFVLNTGDLVEISILPGQWNDFFDVVLPMMADSAYFPIMGNHEFWGGQVFFRKYFNTPDHSEDTASRFAFQYGNTYFINIDIAQFFIPGSVQYQWVVDQLEMASDVPSIKHCVVQAHFPPYSASNHGSDLDVMSFRNSMTPLFEQYHVDVVFGGHDHNYQHSLVNDIHYIVTGGGGAPTYSVDPEEWTVAYEKSNHYIRIDVVDDVMTVTAKRTDGTVIETFDITNDFGGLGAGDELPVPCADGDYDQDGLTDGEEYGMCTDPYNADTDGDTYSDGDEVAAGSDPCDENSIPSADDDTTDDDVTPDDDTTDDDITPDDDTTDDDATPDDDTTDDDVAPDDDTTDDDVAPDDDATDDDLAPNTSDDDDDDGCGC